MEWSMAVVADIADIGYPVFVDAHKKFFVAIFHYTEHRFQSNCFSINDIYAVFSIVMAPGTGAIPLGSA
jgi:hypothetical protein